jgi:hypothetical protein
MWSQIGYQENKKTRKEKNLERDNLLYSVGLDSRTSKPISVDISSILQQPLGFRTKPLYIIANIKDEDRIEIVGEGPNMTWTQGILAHQENGSWVVEMPEGNYNYKVAIRHSTGSLSLENVREDRKYIFSQKQSPIVIEELRQ